MEKKAESQRETGIIYGVGDCPRHSHFLGTPKYYGALKRNRMV